MKKIKCVIASYLILLSWTGGAQAQDMNDGERFRYSMTDLKKSLLWSDSYNAAGLYFMDFLNYSYAEAFFSKGDGKFVNCYGSDDSYDLGLRTESYRRLGKVALYGGLEYDNFRGENMTNTGFMFPDRYMVNVADSIPGSKRAETYTLKAGLSVPIYRQLYGGASVNYLVGELAKMRDLRHKTKYMDMEMNAGLMYGSKYVNVGATYYYRKFYEKPEFSQISPSEEGYRGFYFKGLWFGMFEEWSSDAITLTRPFVDKVNGATAQIELLLGRKFRFFNEFAYKSQEGKSGEGKENSITVAETEIYEYAGKLAYSASGSTHYLTARTSYSTADNYEYITRSEQESSGAPVIVFYGRNRIMQRNIFDLNAEYEAAFGNPYSPSLVIGGGYTMYKRNTTISLDIPYYYSQKITANDCYIYARKNLSWGRTMLDISLRLGVGKGNGDKLTRLKAEMAAESSSEYTPEQKPELLNMEYEYLTAARINGELGFRYSLLPAGNSKNVFYCDARYGLTKAKDIVYIDGSSYGMLKLAVGVSF